MEQKCTVNVMSLNDPNHSPPADPGSWKIVCAKPLLVPKRWGTAALVSRRVTWVRMLACLLGCTAQTSKPCTSASSFQIQERAWSQHQRHWWFNGWGFTRLGRALERHVPVWWTAGRTWGQSSLLRGREMTNSRGVDVGGLISYWGHW